MGKTNEERAGLIIPKFIKYIKWGSSYEEIESPIVIALDKAEKRGRRKERERGTKYVVEESSIAGTVLFVYGEDGYEEARYYLDQHIKQQPFDAEKVKGLIRRMTHQAKLVGKYHTYIAHDYQVSAEKKYDELRAELLAELGIDD